MTTRTSTRRTRTLTLAALLASVTALSACGAGKAEAPAGDAGDGDGGSTAAASDCPVGEPDESIETSVRIDYQSIPNGDLLVKQEGLLEACMPNADISWINFESGGAAIHTPSPRSHTWLRVG